MGEARRNERYLPGVELPRDLRVHALGADRDDLARADLVFLGVPSKGIAEAMSELDRLGVSERAGIVSMAKGLVPPYGTPPAVALEAVFGSERVACVGGPAHAREMVETGAGLVCASRSEDLAHGVAEAFQAAGVVCEVSDDPVGVELAGVAKNAAAVAVGATQAQGLNAAGMAAADIFLEVLSLAASAAGRPARSWAGPAPATSWPPRWPRARATARRASCWPRACPAPRSPGGSARPWRRSRPCACWPRRSSARGSTAPVTSALAHLIEGTLPLDDWISMVRAKQPAPARFRSPRTWWTRLRDWLRRRFRRA